MHRGSTKVKHDKPKEEISAAIFHQIYEKDRKKLEFMQSLNVPGDPSHSPPARHKVYPFSEQVNKGGSSGAVLNDQEFYEAFNPKRKDEPLTITPALFDDLIRRDKMKKEFVKRFTNVYDGPEETPRISQQQQQRPASPPRIPVREMPPYPLRDSPSMIVRESSQQNVRIRYADIDRQTQDEIESYLSKYWSNECPFPSVYPMLLKLEREHGPGWRLDKVGEHDLIPRDAYPNSLINFTVAPHWTAFSIWRQRL